MSDIITGGYGSRVSMSGMDLLCSSFSAGIRTNLIRSSAMYGGKKSSAVSAPHGHDFRDASLSISFPVTRDYLNSLLKIFKDRTDPFKVVCSMPGDKSAMLFRRCLMESLTLSCSRGSLLEASCSLFTMRDQLDSSSVGGFSSGRGDPELSGYEMDWSKPSKLTNVIPYWMTKMKSSEHSFRALSWSFAISHEIVRKSYCSGLSTKTEDAPYPTEIFVGPMSVTGEVEYFIGNESTVYSTFNMDGGKNEKMSLYIGSTKFAEFGRVHVLNQSPVIDASSPYSVNCSYESFSIDKLGD